MNKTFTKILSGFAVAAVLCAPAYAQELDVKWDDDVKLPAKLKWEKMKIASKHKGYPNTVNGKEHERLYSLWAKDIGKHRTTTPGSTTIRA